MPIIDMNILQDIDMMEKHVGQNIEDGKENIEEQVNDEKNIEDNRIDEAGY